jgi:hypothetical protein
MLMLLFVDVEHGELSMMCDAVIATSASWKCVGKFKAVAWRQFQFLYLHFYQSSQELKFFIIISNSLQNNQRGATDRYGPYFENFCDSGP